MRKNAAFAFFGLTLLIFGFGGLIYGVVDELVERHLDVIMGVPAQGVQAGVFGWAFGFAAILAGSILLVRSDQNE